MRISFYAALLVPLFFLFTVPAMARVLIDGSGYIMTNHGVVLSSGSGSDGKEDSSGSDNDDSDSSGDSDEDSSGSEPSKSGSSSDSSGSGSDDTTKTETRSSDGTRTKTEVRDDGEIRTEVRLSDGSKVKTRNEEDRTRTDVYQGGVKTRLEHTGDRFRIKAENELGEETDLGEDTLISIEERVDRNQIRVRAFKTAADQIRNRSIIERLNTQAITDLPLSVNLETNALTVTTPAGERTVTVLPDQAVKNILAANVIDRIGGQELVQQVRDGGIETLDQVIRLYEQNGVPVYEIAGVKEHRFLGFFPVTTDVTVTVSAETAEVVDTHQSFFDTVLAIFSFQV